VEQCDGSILQFVQNIVKDGNSYLAAAYPQPSWTGLQYIGVFGVIQAALLALLPGRRYYGPVTPKGNVPQYKASSKNEGGCTSIHSGAAVARLLSSKLTRECPILAGQRHAVLLSHPGHLLCGVEAAAV
jgi:hypothetical protein